MYFKLKTGKRGEIVIPAMLRRKYGIAPGKLVKLQASERTLEFVFVNEDAVQRFREIAAREKMASKQLVYGDRIYEEVFA